MNAARPIDIIGRLQHDLNAKSAEVEVVRTVGLWRVRYWRELYHGEQRARYAAESLGAVRQRFGLYAGLFGMAGVWIASQNELAIGALAVVLAAGLYAIPFLFPLHAVSDEPPSSLTSTAGVACQREPTSTENAA
ncbi:MAG: hypothetical protein C0499_05705 [Zymomonas sp.]|nr:hypothetical protein [Zymomonas sp.]